jgi:hypothetical protein
VPTALRKADATQSLRVNAPACPSFSDKLSRHRWSSLTSRRTDGPLTQGFGNSSVEAGDSFSRPLPPSLQSWPAKPLAGKKH